MGIQSLDIAQRLSAEGLSREQSEANAREIVLIADAAKGEAVSQQRFDAEMTLLRNQIDTDMALLRNEMSSEFALVREEMAGRMEQMRNQTLLGVGAIIAIVAALFRLLG